MSRFIVVLSAMLTLLVTTVSAQKVLTEISLEGVEKGDERAILALVPLTVGETYTQDDVGKTIRQLYKTKKFRTIKMYAINETETTTGVRIAVEINPYCDGVEFAGNKKLTKSKLKEIVTINRGELLTDAVIYQNIVKIKKAYHEKGYLQAEVECELIPTSIPGYVIAKFRMRERDKIRVEKINFSGNSAYSTKKIMRKFKTKERHIFSSGEYDDELFGKHLDTLMQTYKEDGYLEARIVSDTVYYNADTTGLIVDVQLEEGKQFYVGNFYFRNNKIITTPTLQQAVTMRQGKPFNTLKFAETEGMVGNAYRNEGYLWAQLTPTYKHREDTIDVIFDVVEGNPAIVRKINIAGNDKTREQVIRRELVIYPGQKYSQALMERSIREVRQLNYFDNVVPDIAPNEDGTIDLVFGVKEKENIGQFSAGVTYSGTDGFGGNFSVSIPNFRGAGEQLDAMAEVARRRQRYSFGFTEPWIFNTPTSFSARAFFERQGDYKDNTDPYAYQRLGTEFGFGRKLKWPDDYFSGAIRYMISYDWNNNNYADFGKDRGVTIIEEGLLSRLYLSLVRNDTNYPQFPTRGSIFRTSGYIGGLGGQYNYLKGIVQYDWYHPLFWKFVMGAKTKFGMIGSLGETRLGYNDFFHVGGVYRDGVVRGYGESTLGVDLLMMTLSAEIRFPIIDQQFYMGGFFDMGRSWNEIGDVNIADMYKGAGVGFRLMLPMVGLLGFDFGWPLDHLNHSPINKDYSFSGKPQFYFIMNRGF